MTCASLPAQLATAQQRADTDLQRRIDDMAAQHHGHVALYARQLNTGRTLTIDADLPVQTASTVKLTMLWEITRQVAAGTARWDEPLTLKVGEAVPGSGILTLLDAPLRITLKDAATLMVIVSDNTATNLMIDRFPLAQVNADMASLGYGQTWFYKKVYKPADGPLPPDQKTFGLGKTTARQMASVMERLGRCQLDLPGAPPVDPARAADACAVSLNMLKNQFYRETIPRYLEAQDSTEAGSGIANKTGSLDAARSDVAIIAAKSGPIVLAIYTYGNQDQSWTVDNQGELLIAKLAESIVKAWAPDGLAPASLKPGLNLDASASPTPSK